MEKKSTPSFEGQIKEERSILPYTKRVNISEQPEAEIRKGATRSELREAACPSRAKRRVEESRGTTTKEGRSHSSACRGRPSVGEAGGNFRRPNVGQEEWETTNSPARYESG